jgi:hypothetical protein
LGLFVSRKIEQSYREYQSQRIIQVFDIPQRLYFLGSAGIVPDRERPFSSERGKANAKFRDSYYFANALKLWQK